MVISYGESKRILDGALQSVPKLPGVTYRILGDELTAILHHIRHYSCRGAAVLDDHDITRADIYVPVTSGKVIRLTTGDGYLTDFDPREFNQRFANDHSGAAAALKLHHTHRAYKNAVRDLSYAAKRAAGKSGVVNLTPVIALVNDYESAIGWDALQLPPLVSDLCLTRLNGMYRGGDEPMLGNHYQFSRKHAAWRQFIRDWQSFYRAHSELGYDATPRDVTVRRHLPPGLLRWMPGDAVAA